MAFHVLLLVGLAWGGLVQAYNFPEAKQAALKGETKSEMKEQLLRGTTFDINGEVPHTDRSLQAFQHPYHHDKAKSCEEERMQANDAQNAMSVYTGSYDLILDRLLSVLPCGA